MVLTELDCVCVRVSGWKQDHPEATSRANRARAAVTLPGGVPRAPQEQRRQEGRGQGPGGDGGSQAPAGWAPKRIRPRLVDSRDRHAHSLRCRQRSQGRILGRRLCLVDLMLCRHGRTELYLYFLKSMISIKFSFSNAIRLPLCACFWECDLPFQVLCNA